MVNAIRLFEVLRVNFTEDQAKQIVHEIEQIEAEVEVKVDKKFDQSKDVLATKNDIANLRGELKEDIANLRGEMKAENANTRADIIKWMFIFWIGQLASFIAIAKVFFHQ